MARFEADYAGEAYESVLSDCAEGAAWFGVSGLPTVILNEKLSLVGAVPIERYRLLIDWILAGEPGGVIPLAAETAGQSVVESAAPYLAIRMTESARSTPMAMLKIRSRRGSRRTCCSVAPNASHTKPLGSAASTNRPPSHADCTIGAPLPT